MASELIQVIYKYEQKDSCFPFARVYFNTGLTIFFENAVISKLVMESKEDKIAVCSWKLKDKLRWNVCRPRPLTQDVLNTEYDVLSFTCNTQYHQMLTSMHRHHAGSKEAMAAICESIGQKVPNEVKNPIYQNHFSAKIGIYRDYVVDWLQPAMNVMTEVPEINKMIMADSNYSQLNKKDAISAEVLQDKIGVPFYPLAPFVLERLFSIYVHNNKIPVTWL